MRPLALTLIAAVLIATACGGDDDRAEDKPVTAASFTECFELAGFEAVKPKPREESVLAFQAKQKGYAVEPVNVQKKGMLTPHAFLVLFASEDKAKEAMKDLNATAYGDVPPQQSGPVVIGYGDTENKAAVAPAVEECV